MSVETSTVRARFALRFRCANCRKLMTREVISPNHSDAPADVEELLESNLLNRQLYPCEECENPISVLIGVRQLMPDEALDVDTSGNASKITERALGTMSPATRRRGLGQGIGRSPH